MIQKLFNSFAHRFVSRWAILAKDIILLTASLILAYFLRFNFSLSEDQVDSMWLHVFETGILAVVAFLIYKPYEGIIRHTSIEDVLRLARSLGLLAAMLVFINIIDRSFGDELYFSMPYSILIIYVFVGSFALLFSRMVIKLMFNAFAHNGAPRNNILIYGAGHAGLTTANAIASDKNGNLRVSGFLDSNPLFQGKTILGVPVYSPDSVDEDLINRLNVKDVIFCIQKVEPEEKRRLIEDLISRAPLLVKDIPPVSRWVNGELSLKQINKVRIEDLLQRDSINLDSRHLIDELRDKVILVSGAAGSIGSELSRQLCHFFPARLVLFDQAESGLFDLQQELSTSYPSMRSKIDYVVGDVSNNSTVERIFTSCRPHMVYHAAAYKHVPLMENNPFEAVRVNVFGTRVMADAASRFRVQKFVMISTDKAVNPSNVMGATKRVAEIYIQSLNLKKGNKTAFITTRFGNVLGSNGSVIPLFEKQIAAGGPVTVTHPDIIRYFMTIPEACQLVFEAGVMGMGGEIFLFDMGNPVKINDLALQMIRLSGLKPDKDIRIEYCGLRPGEKLYEELLNDGENNLPTHHKKITIAQVRHYPPSEVDAMFLDLNDSFLTFDRVEVVAQLKRIVPEFKSNNSEYQALDKAAV